MGTPASSKLGYGPVLIAIAAVLAIVSVITRPFLFIPIAVMIFLTGARATPSRRMTAPVASLIAVCFVVGAGIAAGTNNPLY
jgi:hypothetical protein